MWVMRSIMKALEFFIKYENKDNFSFNQICVILAFVAILRLNFYSKFQIHINKITSKSSNNSSGFPLI